MDRSNILLPWIKIGKNHGYLDDNNCWLRRTIDDKTVKCIISYAIGGFGQIPENLYWARMVNNALIDKDFTSLQDAQNYVDEQIVKNGYIPLTQEQWDKYQLLV